MTNLVYFSILGHDDMNFGMIWSENSYSVNDTRGISLLKVMTINSGR